MKRRILKYLSIGLVILVLGGYWAFSTFFFNPLEGRYEFDLSSLIPREVDFYFAKAELRRDFDPLPRLAFADKLVQNERGQAFLELETVQGLLKELQVEESLAPLEATLAQLPVEADPLTIFGGIDLALAGHFKGERIEDADWAVYGRANWLGKLGVEIVAGGFFDLAAQGITVTKLPDRGVSLSGGQLPRPLFMTRILDVIVVATTQELVDQVHVLEASRGEDSFGQSAKYFDHVASVATRGDELEAYVDYRALSENMRIPGTWPDPHADVLWAAIAGKLFQVGTVRELLASAAFTNGITLNATGLLSSELMTPVQKRLYRQQGFDRAEIFELSKMATADSGLFFAMRGPIGELLRQFLASLEEAAVTNLEDVIREVWGYADAHPLIEDLDAAFKDRFAVFLRNLDYAPDESQDAPQTNDIPVPVWAVTLEIDDAKAVEGIRSRITSGQARLGIQGRQPGSRGVFENTGAGGSRTYEYHAPLVPGTGHIATLEMAGPGDTRYLVISNSHQFLGQIFVTYRRADAGRLSEDGAFETLVNAGLPSADALLWLNPRAMSDTSRTIAAYNAGLDILSAIDWRIERPRLEKKVLKEHFPEETYGSVSPANEDSFQMLVDKEAERFQSEFEAQHLVRMQAENLREVQAWELTSGALIELAMDQKRFELYGRVLVPLD